MRAALIAFAFAACAATPVGAQEADPLAPARDGAMECYSPNKVARTCRAMSLYRFQPNGEITNDGVLHIQSDPLVLMHASSPVVVRDGLVCGRVDRAEIDRLRFTVEGQAAPEDLTLELRNAIEMALAGAQEICSRYTPDADGIAITSYADGVERPDLADRMIWVRPEDGYTVAVPDTSAT